MMTKAKFNRPSAGGVAHLWPAALCAVLCALIAATACTKDTRMAGQDVPHVTVETVRDQGITLDVNATPQQVAFVLLKAIRDDLLAGGDQEARQAALERQLAVSDPDYLYDAYLGVYKDHAVHTRDEWAYKKVRLWAPTLAYYVAAFDFDFARANELMTLHPTPAQEKWSGQTMMVELPAPDPNGDPNAAVIIQIRLHKHADQYWRVFHVGFAKDGPARLAAS